MKVVKCIDISRSEKYKWKWKKIICDALLSVNDSLLLGSGVLKLWQDNHIRSCSFSSITKLCSMNSFTTTSAYTAAVSAYTRTACIRKQYGQKKKKSETATSISCIIHKRQMPRVSHPFVIYTPSYVRVVAPTIDSILLWTPNSFIQCRRSLSNTKIKYLKLFCTFSHRLDHLLFFLGWIMAITDYGFFICSWLLRVHAGILWFWYFYRRTKRERFSSVHWNSWVWIDCDRVRQVQFSESGCYTGESTQNPINNK